MSCWSTSAIFRKSPARKKPPSSLHYNVRLPNGVVSFMAHKKLAKRATLKSKTSSLKPKAKSPKPRKFVYFFGNGKADGDRTMKDTLGGKGSGLAEMTNAGLPVPPGFTISTDVCNLYYAEKGKVPADIDR